MTAAGFIAGTLFMATLVVLAAVRYLGAKAAGTVGVGLSVWLIYVGTLSALGVVGNPALRPPGAFYVVIPVIAFVALFAVRSRRGAEVARAFPIQFLMGAQVFRVGVELGLHQLWQQGLIPRLMTYEGGNVDIAIGLSAPLMAWLVGSGKVGRRTAILWNALGLLALSNIVVRSTLTAPGPLNFIQGEVPNLAIGTFPYTFVAGFLAPMALVLHILSIRHLRATPTPVSDHFAGIGQFGQTSPRDTKARQS